MRVYLGSRYSRLDEMRQHAEELRARGYTVDAHWLGGHGDLVGETSKAEGSAAAQKVARQDVADLFESHVAVIFTDPPEYKSKNGRGGFHVEFGIALALKLMTPNRRLLLVGHRINSFHHHLDVEFFSTWEDALKTLPNVAFCIKCGTRLHFNKCPKCGPCHCPECDP